MKVNEIFSSIDGEGSRTGYPVTFIRLFDCNLRCSYCDTMYAVEGSDYRDMTIEEILEALKRQGLSRITLTGGEPLLHDQEVFPLLEALIQNGYKVNVETNGAVSLAPFESLRQQTQDRPESFFYTLDYKSLSSGMNQAMKLDNFNYLRSFDVLKFVVGSQEDLEDMERVVRHVLPRECPAEIYVSPVFGQIEARELVDYILQHKLENVRVQLQMHKYIWNPNERGV